MNKKIKIKEVLIYKTIAKILKTSVNNLEKKDNLESYANWDSLVHLEIPKFLLSPSISQDPLNILFVYNLEISSVLSLQLSKITTISSANFNEDKHSLIIFSSLCAIIKTEISFFIKETIYILITQKNEKNINF